MLGDTLLVALCVYTTHRATHSHTLSHTHTHTHSVGGSLPVIFSYMSEFIRNKYRGPYLGVQATFWMLGTLLCGAIAWIIIPRQNIQIPMGDITITSWRVFIAVSAAPSLIGALLYSVLPESPRFSLEVWFM